MDGDLDAPRASRYRLIFPWGSEEVAASGRLGLGRDPEFSPFAARLMAFPTVSARHAELTWSEAGVAVVDHSSNGTYVNGSHLVPAEPTAVHDGDEIHLSAACSVVVEACA